MKRLLFLFFLLPCLSRAQESKGVQPAPPTAPGTSPAVTRAVVVGISDYQANEIPDLQYAHRDAEKFAAWLQSPAGGGVPAENIVLLTNEKATQAKLVAALDGLLEACQDGDRAIIYFSGHGDVERKTMAQPGYLLCYDSPPQTYMAGGAFNLRDLQDIISTLSLQNKARVIVITDACHAGKLAGSEISGTAATAQALTRPVANEVKIMSCQPTEFSLEGKQWDDGRGVFSYHLLEGLTGLADLNGDGTVNLFDIQRYLQDKVPAETAPHSQIPMTSGDLQTPLNRVDAKALAELRVAKAGRQPQLAQTGSKGLDAAFLSDSDSLLQAKYRAFETALEQRMLFEPPGICANDLYEQLIQNQQLKPLHSLLRRNLAAALQDEVQQALNALLDNDSYEANNWLYKPEKYTQYPFYLERSMELLGENHYMYRTLLAKKYYFEGYNLAKNIGDQENQPVRRDSFKMAAKAKFLESIQLQPEAAYPYRAIGNLYFVNDPYQSDSLVYWDSRAVELSPNWLAPYLDITNEYQSAQTDLQQTESWLLKALALHPQSYLVLERLAWLKQWQGKAEESIAISKKMIDMKPELFNAYSTLAYTLAYMKGDFLECEKYCLKSIELEPNQGWRAQWSLAISYVRTKRAEQAAELSKACLESLKSSSYEKSNALTTLTAALVQMGRYDEAAQYFRLLDSFQFGDPFNKTWVKMNEGRMYFQEGQWAQSEKTLEAALLLDPTNDPVWITLWALLGEIKAIQGQPGAAEELFQKALSQRKNLGDENLFRDEAFFRYGKFLLAQKRFTEAEAKFREIGHILPKSYYYGYGMALLAASRGKQTEALDWLERSLDNFWPDAGLIQREPLFQKLRKTKRFKALMAKYFPPGWQEK